MPEFWSIYLVFLMVPMTLGSLFEGWTMLILWSWRKLLERMTFCTSFLSTWYILIFKCVKSKTWFSWHQVKLSSISPYRITASTSLWKIEARCFLTQKYGTGVSRYFRVLHICISVVIFTVIWNLVRNISI